MWRIFVSLAGSSADMCSHLSERHYKRVKWNDVSMLSMLIWDHSQIAWYLLGVEFVRGCSELGLHETF